ADHPDRHGPGPALRDPRGRPHGRLRRGLQDHQIATFPSPSWGGRLAKRAGWGETAKAPPVSSFGRSTLPTRGREKTTKGRRGDPAAFSFAGGARRGQARASERGGGSWSGGGS